MPRVADLSAVFRNDGIPLRNRVPRCRTDSRRTHRRARIARGVGRTGLSRYCARRKWRRSCAKSLPMATPMPSLDSCGGRATGRAQRGARDSARVRRIRDWIRSSVEDRCIGNSCCSNYCRHSVVTAITSLGEGPVDPLEILESGEIDGDPAPAGRVHRDLHPSFEVVAEHLLEFHDPGRPLAPPAGCRGGSGSGRCLRFVVVASDQPPPPPGPKGLPSPPGGRVAPGTPGRACRAARGRGPSSI